MHLGEVVAYLFGDMGRLQKRILEHKQQGYPSGHCVGDGITLLLGILCVCPMVFMATVQW